MGWHAQPTRQVIMQDVRVPVGNRLGGEHDGFAIALAAINNGRIMLSSCSVGGGQWALDKALRYVQERQAFGKPLAANQGLVFMLADMATDLEAARGLLQRAATALRHECSGCHHALRDGEAVRRPMPGSPRRTPRFRCTAVTATFGVRHRAGRP